MPTASANCTCESPACWRKLARRCPLSVALFFAGLPAMRRQRVRRAQWMIEELERSIRLVPNDADRYYGQAVAQLMLGRIQEAIMTLGSAVKAEPDHLPALNLLGEILLKVGEYKKAASVLEKVLSHEPDNMTVITGLCLAYHCLDKKGKELSRDSILQTIAPDLLATSLKT